jgi:hypothetical protein
MADIKRLIGDDGKLVRASVALTLTSGTLTEGWYKIGTKAVSSSAFGDGTAGLDVGEYYYAPATVTLTAGDAAYAVTTTVMADLSGWGLNLTGDEVEVTVMGDTYKKYRKGKLDAQGTASFVFIKGETDASGGLASYFFKQATITASGVVSSVVARSDNSLTLIGYMDAEEDTGEYFLATAFDVEFFNFDLPMNSSEPVSMEVPYRLIGATDPVLYKVTNA